MITLEEQNAVAAQDLANLLESYGGSYVAVYEQIVATEDRKAVELSRTNAAGRKAAWHKALANRSRKAVAKVNAVFTSFVKDSKAAAPILFAENPGVLDYDEAVTVGLLAAKAREAKEIADANWDAVKQRVFASMTADFAVQGEEFPEHVAGSIELPTVGLVLKREGTGREEPEVQEHILAAAVGEDVWARVTREEIIPAQTVREFDIDLFMAEARKNPALLEDLRRSLKVGKWKSPRFAVRDFQVDE